MRLSDINPMPEYFDRYILQADDKELFEVLQTSLDELSSLPLDKWEALGDRTYAEGKWTIKDTLQHLIDTERIFSYRALCFARADTALIPSFDEALYAQSTNVQDRTISDLLEELRLVRTSFIALFRSFTPEMLMRTGLSWKGQPYSVLSIGFMIPGHQRHHFRILEEKYLPLLK
jgi:hypothetical protein